jgi:hypothetical protein
VETVLADECADLSHMRVNFHYGSTTNRRVLDDLEVETYDHIITLSYMDVLEPQEADARTLITLLHLRDIGETIQCHFSIVSEMLDLQNRELAEITRADDFIVSDRLVSLMLSQLAENRELIAVLTELFDPDGVELYLKPAGDFVVLGQPVDFYTVVEAARRQQAIAIGYRLHAQANDLSYDYGVYVNPNKARRVTFAAEDKIIVLAED